MSDTEPRTAIRVEIAGEEYTLRAEADEEYARRCAALVDERMRKVTGKGGASAKHAAIMAALDLSDELLRVGARIGERLQGLTASIEKELDS